MGGGTAGSSPGSSNSNKIKVVYITGVPRSGSTVFGTVLGGHPDAYHVGELRRIPYPAWNEGYRCACGALAVECEFWSPVKRDLEKSFTFKVLRKGQLRYERWRGLPKTLVTRRTDPELRAHVKRLARVAHAVAERSGKRIIVDSSKSPARGRLYQFAAEEGIDVRYIHLIRDGRGFLWSEMTLPGGIPDPHPEWRFQLPVLTMHWPMVNLLSTLLCGGPRHRQLLVRYEDFVADPAAVLRRVGAFIDEDMTSVIAALQKQEPIPIGHPVGGNRMRFGEPVRLKPDTAWKSGLKRGPQVLFWTVAGWAALAYGYRPRATDRPSRPAVAS